MRFATWNVRTMCPGLSNDPSEIDDSRKTAIINSELKRLNIDIAAENHMYESKIKVNFCLLI